MKRALLAACLLPAVCLHLAGCLEREEVITVRPDGGVEMTVTLETGSESELHEGDAVPNLERGWITTFTIEKDEEERESFRLLAEQVFKPEATLPEDYAGLTSQYRDAVLKFPTTVQLEDRRDGIYYHFRRVYTPRSWAQLEGPREKFQERIEEILDKRDLESLSDAERQEILRLAADAEMIRFRGFARSAFRDAAGDAPQDVWLQLDREIGKLTATLDIEAIAGLLLQAQEDPRAAEQLEFIVKSLEITAGDSIEAVLRASGWFSGARIKEFMTRYDYHRMRHTITSDLIDDRFQIVVRMPGEIVAHNGEGSGTEVRWKFDGSRMQDRELELMVTSVVPHPAD